MSTIVACLVMLFILHKWLNVSRKRWNMISNNVHAIVHAVFVCEVKRVPNFATEKSLQSVHKSSAGLSGKGSFTAPMSNS